MFHIASCTLCTSWASPIYLEQSLMLFVNLVHVLVIMRLWTGYARDDMYHMIIFWITCLTWSMTTWNAYHLWLSIRLWIAFAWILALYLAFAWNSCSLQLDIWSRCHCKCLAHDAPKGSMTSLCRKGTSCDLVYLHMNKNKNWLIMVKLPYQVFTLHDDILFGLVVTWCLPKEVGTWFQQALTWLMMLIWVFAMTSCWECIFVIRALMI